MLFFNNFYINYPVCFAATPSFLKGNFWIASSQAPRNDKGGVPRNDKGGIPRNDKGDVPRNDNLFYIK